ncbi:hypothetical protein K501DRAFT_278698 [Backusella circina FSU 941]|nr:hypothetical protein K501DRAFT_278698 [Backusella circina FSU 941]
MGLTFDVLNDHEAFLFKEVSVDEGLFSLDFVFIAGHHGYVVVHHGYVFIYFVFSFATFPLRSLPSLMSKNELKTASFNSVADALDGIVFFAKVKNVHVASCFRVTK